MGAIGAQKQRRLDLIDHIINKEAMGFQANRVDHCIRPNAASHLHQGFVGLGFLEIDRLSTEIFSPVPSGVENGRSR